VRLQLDHVATTTRLHNAQVGSNICIDTHFIALYSATPSSVFNGERNNVNISGSNFFPSTLFSCHFGASVANATYLEANTIQCMSPNLASTVVDLTVYLNTSIYASNSLPFTFYGSLMEYHLTFIRLQWNILWKLCFIISTKVLMVFG
jgi:hypothetical protein